MVNKWLPPKMNELLRDELKSDVKSGVITIREAAIKYRISYSYATRIAKGAIKSNVERKLSNEELESIKIDSRTQVEIGRAYGISQSMVSRIKSGREYQSRQYRINRRNEKALIEKWTIKLVGERKS